MALDRVQNKLQRRNSDDITRLKEYSAVDIKLDGKAESDITRNYKYFEDNNKKSEDSHQEKVNAYREYINKKRTEALSPAIWHRVQYGIDKPIGPQFIKEAGNMYNRVTGQEAEKGQGEAMMSGTLSDASSRANVSSMTRKDLKDEAREPGRKEISSASDIDELQKKAASLQEKLHIAKRGEGDPDGEKPWKLRRDLSRTERNLERARNRQKRLETKASIKDADRRWEEHLHELSEAFNDGVRESARLLGQIAGRPIGGAKRKAKAFGSEVRYVGAASLYKAREVGQIVKAGKYLGDIARQTKRLADAQTRIAVYHEKSEKTDQEKAELRKQVADLVKEIRTLQADIAALRGGGNRSSAGVEANPGRTPSGDTRTGDSLRQIIEERQFRYVEPRPERGRGRFEDPQQLEERRAISAGLSGADFPANVPYGPPPSSDRGRDRDLRTEGTLKEPFSQPERIREKPDDAEAKTFDQVFRQELRGGLARRMREIGVSEFRVVLPGGESWDVGRRRPEVNRREVSEEAEQRFAQAIGQAVQGEFGKQLSGIGVNKFKIVLPNRTEIDVDVSGSQSRNGEERAPVREEPGLSLSASQRRDARGEASLSEEELDRRLRMAEHNGETHRSQEEQRLRQQAEELWRSSRARERDPHSMAEGQEPPSLRQKLMSRAIEAAQERQPRNQTEVRPSEPASDARRRYRNPTVESVEDEGELLQSATTKREAISSISAGGEIPSPDESRARYQRRAAARRTQRRDLDPEAVERGRRYIAEHEVAIDAELANRPGFSTLPDEQKASLFSEEFKRRMEQDSRAEELRKIGVEKFTISKYGYDMNVDLS
jgi:hypothetical protein